MVGAWVRDSSLLSGMALSLVGCSVMLDPAPAQDTGLAASDASAEAVTTRPTDAGQASKPTPELVAALPPRSLPTDLLVTSDFLYFAAAGSVPTADGQPRDMGFVRRVRRDDDSIEDVWTGPASSIKIAYAEGNLYLLPFDYPGRTGKLICVAENGTASTVPGSTWNSPGSTIALTATDFGPVWYYTTGSGGGSLAELISGGITALAPIPPGADGLLAAVGDQLYWVSSGSTILSTPASTPSQPAVVLSGRGGISALRGGTRQLFIVAGTQLLAFGRGQEPRVIVDSPLLRGASSIQTVGGRIYGVNPSMGIVVLADELDGTLETVASGQAAPIVVAADEIAVFWINASDRTVMRLRY